MNEDSPTNVFAAFEMLLEEIEVEIINKAGANAFQRSDYDRVEQHRESARQATVLRDKLVDLRKEWETLMASHHDKEEEEVVHDERRNMGHLERGLRTPESAFRQSILKALNEMGGSARMSDVLKSVHELMRDILKEVGHEPLPAGGVPRWSKSAQWERYTMAKGGLLKQGSRRGRWEITEDGRKALAKGTR